LLPPGVQEDGLGPKIQDGHPAPGPAQARKPNRLWKLPLVSSVVIATSGLVLRQLL
jgi:hypothetical protein